MAKKVEDVDIGFDISTRIVGMVVLDAKTGNLKHMKAFILTSSKLEDLWDKVDFMRDKLSKFFNTTEYNVRNVFVEEAHIRFATARSSASTLFSLAGFNKLVSYFAYKTFGVKPTYINERSARKALGIKIDQTDKSISTKEKVFAKVKEMNPNFPWQSHVAKNGKHKGQNVWSKQNFDLADAWVIVAGGRKLLAK